MRALLMRLAAPMQSWGNQSRFIERDTQLEPSKSGVLGIVAAALGRRRGDALDDLAGLSMGVRVDREGKKLVDFHTAGGGNAPPEFLALHSAKTYGVSKANGNTPDTAVTRRQYLSDARFLVALAGEEALLRRIVEGLGAPVFPLFLGRKSFVPTEPVLHDRETPLRDGESLRSILEVEAWEAHPHDLRWDSLRRCRVPKSKELRLVLEVGEAEQASAARRPDHPISFVRARREFRERLVRTEFTSKPIDRWLAAQAGRAEGTPAA